MYYENKNYCVNADSSICVPIAGCVHRNVNKFDNDLYVIWLWLYYKKIYPLRISVFKQCISMCMLYVHGTFNKSFEEWREIFFAIEQLQNIQYLYFDKNKNLFLIEYYWSTRYYLFKDYMISFILSKGINFDMAIHTIFSYLLFVFHKYPVYNNIKVPCNNTSLAQEYNCFM